MRSMKKLDSPIDIVLRLILFKVKLLMSIQERKKEKEKKREEKEQELYHEREPVFVTGSKRPRRADPRGMSNSIVLQMDPELSIWRALK
jgi:hypothetical protein